PALAPRQARPEPRDPELRRVPESLAVDPGVEERREIAVEHLALADRRPVRAEDPEQPVDEGGHHREGQQVAFHERVLPVAVREEPAQDRLAQEVEPFVGPGCEVERRPVVLRRVARVELPRVDVELRVAVQEGVQQRPARPLRLRDEHERLLHGHERRAERREEVLRVVPAREAEVRLGSPSRPPPPGPVGLGRESRFGVGSRAPCHRDYPANREALPRAPRNGTGEVGTLELFFADGETPAPAVVVPQLASASLDPLATAVVELLPARRRRLLPAPEPGIAAARVRSWYRDAWFARAEVERRSLVAATGQGAACLAALLRDRCTVTAAVREPLQAMAALAETGVELPRPDGLLALGSGDARALKPRVWLASNPQSRALLSGLAETD